MMHDSMISLMLEKARKAQQMAYAPYSNFKVGACMRTNNNNLYIGCNIENVSYSVTMCAENTALANMFMAGENAIAEMLVIGSGNLICSPCGRCRQLISEFAAPDILIHMCNQEGLIETSRLAELLPYAFSPRNLEHLHD